MYYKISNTAERERIERLFGVSLKNPNIYNPEVLINGFDESNILIVTEEEPKVASLAIWGMLPEGFEEDWDVFQSTTNTLNIDARLIDSELWCASSFEKRRCLIVLTGFFTTFLKDGNAYPYHIGLPSGEPFFLAGIYNTLDDGFLTSSMLVGETDEFTRQFQNVVDCKPIVISQNVSETWLDSTTPINKIKELMSEPLSTELHATPIEKEFFNQDISYNSMLERHTYPNLP